MVTCVLVLSFVLVVTRFVFVFLLIQPFVSLPMCQFRVKIKARNAAGIRWSYVPCGVCVDCRRHMAHDWQFRLNSEFLYLIRKGWMCGFCTLTYRDECLPHIPEECFKNPEDYRPIPCFQKSDCQDWIINVRQHFKRSNGFVGDKRIRYFVASELGSRRHRPHYHAILAWPPEVDYKEMHAVCTEYWTHGYLFPRDYRGDDKMLSFEVVGDATKCFSYISKYVCKDLELLALQGNTQFYSVKPDDDSHPDMSLYRAWKNCQSFHIQSKSLGFQAIKDLSDDDKLDVYRNGMSFVGDGEVYQIPIYIKNKLIFTPYYSYDVETGKRIVQRKASDFFLAHADEIFEKKSEFYQKYCSSSEAVDYYTKRGLPEDFAKEICDTLSYYRSMASADWPDLDSDNTLGKLYLAYHRVSQHFRYELPLLSQYMLRYYPDAKLSPDLRPFVQRIDARLQWLDLYWELVDHANSLLGSFCASERAEDDRIKSEILEFFNYEVKNVL